LPAKSTVAGARYTTPGHPESGGAPAPLRPARSRPGQAATRHKFAQFPFGGGPRVCIGNTFALLEGPLVLATILQRFHVELVPGQTVVPDPTFTLRPRDGVKVVLRPR